MATKDQQKDISDVQRLAREAVPLLPPGEQPRPGRGHKVQTKQPTGNRRTYLVRRIARDRPDILERMKVGEFTSVQAAAREAGIIRDTTAATLKDQDAPIVEQMLRLWQKASSEERQAILARIVPEQ